MAYNPYANASYKANTVATYSPGELLIALYDGAILNLSKAKIAISKKDYAEANTMLQKSQKIVRHLKVTLNDSYPISADLTKLYNYFDEQITQCNLHKDSSKIDEILPMLEELKKSFAQADKISRQQRAYSGQ